MLLDHPFENKDAEKCVHSSSKNRNYARSHKIGMSKLVIKVMGNVSLKYRVT